jgi:hypothetical protein
MKTRIALIPFIAVAVVGLGAGLGPVAGDRAAAAPAPAMVVEIAPDVDSAPVARREALKVLPTVTVVPSREELLAARGEAHDGSVVLDAAVDRAAALARPVSAALPRARLGNPFYDFGRTRRALATE